MCKLAAIVAKKNFSLHKMIIERMFSASHLPSASVKVCLVEVGFCLITGGRSKNALWQWPDPGPL